MIIPGKTFAWLSVLFVLLLSPTILMAQSQRVEVQLSSNRVTVDESVILNVRAYGMDQAIDYSSLQQNFDVTQRSSSRQVTIENGKRTSLVEWVLELIPKQTGAIEIPPIVVGPEQSRAVTVLVEPAPTGSNRDIYLESSVDVTNPYVQAQIIYNLRVYIDTRLIDANLQLPEVDGIVMQQLTEERSFQETVDGRNYSVREFRYVVFPQRSGEVVIPPVALQTVVAVNRAQQPNTLTRTKRLTRRSNTIELDVQPRPSGLVGSWWLPAKQVQLQSEWSQPIDSLTVGQPVTRTVQLLARGVGDTQFPVIDVPVVDEISIYADSPETATNAREDGLISRQSNVWAVIPQKAGELTLPEVQVNWFDTQSGEARVAILPEETLIVTGDDTVAVNSAQSDVQNPSGGASADVSGDSSLDSDALSEQALAGDDETGANSDAAEQDALGSVATGLSSSQVVQSLSMWRYIAFASLVGWVLSMLGLWLWFRRRLSRLSIHSDEPATQSSESRFQRRAASKTLLEPVQAAIDSEDPAKISKAVLAWGAMVWPEHAPTNTSQIADQLQSTELAKVFRELDAQQFSGSNNVNSMTLNDIPSMLKRAVDNKQAQNAKSDSSSALPSL